jgi:hypothetical protein
MALLNSMRQIDKRMKSRVSSIRESKGQFCCNYLKLWVVYQDEPQTSYLICPFCGDTEKCVNGQYYLASKYKGF